MSRRAKVFIYLSFFFVIVLISIASLIVTIKTIPVTKAISQANRDIRQLKAENMQLLYEISEATSADILMQKAAAYNMRPVSPANYKHIQKKR